MKRFAMFRSAGGVFVLMLAALALADGLPAGTPDASPTSVPTVPHVATVPPGLHQIVVGETTLYCRPEDDAWLKAAVTPCKPASRPTTSPSDLLASLKAHRAELVKMIVTDFALNDDKAINEAFDKKLIPNMEAFANLKPAVIFMPITQKKLTEVVTGGWTDPRYKYNKVLGDAIYENRIIISWDFKMDDLVLWIQVDPNKDESEMKKTVTETIDFFNTGYLPFLAISAEKMGLRNAICEILDDEAIKPLKLPANLEWFGRGIVSVFAMKYESLISGGLRSDMTKLATMDERGFPLRSQPMDLLNVKTQNDIPRNDVQLWNMYQEAIFIKGASVVNAWVSKGGDGVVAKLLPKIRTAPPADAPALAKMILDTTGFDISPLLPPNYEVDAGK